MRNISILFYYASVRILALRKIQSHEYRLSMHNHSTHLKMAGAKRNLAAVVLPLLMLCGPRLALADLTVIDFEGLTDGTILTTQYPGLIFSNAIVLTSGISLNEFEFPPHSGTNVISDNGGPMSISFSSQVVSFGGYFTYDEPLTLLGFNAMDVQVALASSLFSSNDALFGEPGSSPNEFLQLNAASGITSVTITGDPAGGSFTLDDVTIYAPPTPEPAASLILLPAVVAVVALRKKPRSLKSWAFLIKPAVAIFGIVGPCFYAGTANAASQILAQQAQPPAELTPPASDFSPEPRLAATHTIGAVSALPNSIVPGVPTAVAITALITDPTVITNGVNLLRVNAPGLQPTILGQMQTAGGGIYTIQVTLTTGIDVPIEIEVSAAFKGALQRVLSPTIAISTTEAGLDTGPWPTQDHDNRRSNQSSLVGPESAGTPQLVYDAGSPILSELVITSDGKIVMGGYSEQVVANQVAAIDASGIAAWPAPYSLIPNDNESPIGFTVASSGRIDVAVHDWPDIIGPAPVHMYSLLPNGTSAPNWPIPFSAMYEPAAIAPDGTIYQMDELAVLRALRPADGSVIWQQHLAGFSQGAIASDSSGNLYAGTDGGRYGQNGLWSFSPTGAFRWSTIADTLGTPVVSASDTIYVQSQTGTIYALNQSGALVPGWPVSVSSPPQLLDIAQDPLAVGPSGVYLKTVSGLLALSPDGTQRWAFSPGGSGSLSSAVVLDQDENVYVAFGDAVYSLNSAGRLRWSVPLNSPGNLYIGGAGVLYVISANQQLYAIGAGH